MAFFMLLIMRMDFGAPKLPIQSNKAFEKASALLLFKVPTKTLWSLLVVLSFSPKTRKFYKKVNNSNNLVSSKYPGRANGSPIVDMFITLLSMGKSKLQALKK
jgi:hypothetical protein